MFSVREKRQGDIEALRALFLQARRNTFTWLDTTQYQLSDFEIQTEGELTLVAVSDNQVIGFISLWVMDNFIHHLYVDEQHQNQGVGSGLLTRAAQILKSPIKLKCLEKNVKAIEFYKQKGFFENGTGISDEGSYIVLQLTNIAHRLPTT